MIDVATGVSIILGALSIIAALYLRIIQKSPFLQKLFTALALLAIGYGAGIMSLASQSGASCVDEVEDFTGLDASSQVDPALSNDLDDGHEGGDGTVNAPEPDKDFILFSEEPVEGSRNQKEGAIEDNLGNVFYDALCFSVDTFSSSLEKETLVYINKDNYTNFAGIFYVPKLSEGRDRNTVNFIVRLDDSTVLDTGDIDKYSDPYAFDLDITGVRKIEITCSIVHGTGSGVIGGGASACGYLSDAKFYIKR